MRNWVLIVALALTGCVDQRERPDGDDEVYTIENDGGGQVISAIADWNRLHDWGGPVEIRGYCNSACTIFASLPNACLAPESRYGFHSASIAGVPAPHINLMLRQFYRGEIRDRFDDDWSDSTDLTRISVVEFKQLDPEVRLCDE
ncbi:MAG: hypothetical protein ACK5MY_02460 [Jhaorihella sp.]